jgi:hypothetical protein
MTKEAPATEGHSDVTHILRISEKPDSERSPSTFVRGDVLVDLRNVYLPAQARAAGFNYTGIGIPATSKSRSQLNLANESGVEQRAVANHREETAIDLNGRERRRA